MSLSALQSQGGQQQSLGFRPRDAFSLTPTAIMCAKSTPRLSAQECRSHLRTMGPARTPSLSIESSVSSTPASLALLGSPPTVPPTGQRVCPFTWDCLHRAVAHEFSSRQRKYGSWCMRQVGSVKWMYARQIPPSILEVTPPRPTVSRTTDTEIVALPRAAGSISIEPMSTFLQFAGCEACCQGHEEDTLRSGLELRSTSWAKGGHVDSPATTRVFRPSEST
jgi:hypothetical protein